MNLLARNIALSVAGLFILGGTSLGLKNLLLHSPQRAPIMSADNAMLSALWNDYKANNIDPTTHRTIDKQGGDITTSEGESYTMLRATWVDDQTTFNQSWQWTRTNLQRPDKLFSWKYGPLATGTYGVQTSVGGNNTATDGDSDIALSLLMAYSRWDDPAYLEAAKQIIPAIWRTEVVTITNKPVLVADDLEKNNPQSVVINPSYFAPYAYKIFARVDPKHDWIGLSDNSYSLLAQLSAASLDSPTSSALPPDWARIMRASGEVRSAGGGLDSNYGYDAFRVIWRQALDWEWFQDARDKQVLNNYSFLREHWEQNHSLKAIYSHSGQPLSAYESAAAYGASIGYFSVLHPDDAKAIYSAKLANYKPQAYYDDNWAWFGIALTQHALPNLTENQ